MNGSRSPVRPRGLTPISAVFSTNRGAARRYLADGGSGGDVVDRRRVVAIRDRDGEGRPFMGVGLGEAKDRDGSGRGGGVWTSGAREDAAWREPGLVASALSLTPR